MFGERLAGADASAPAEGHVAFVVGEGAVERVRGEETSWFEFVGGGEGGGVVVDGPDVALDPGSAGDEVALFVFTSVFLNHLRATYAERCVGGGGTAVSTL